MVQLGKEEVIKGLKKFKSIAKQEILARMVTADTDPCKVIAQAEKDMYEELILLIEKEGVQAARVFALSEFEKMSQGCVDVIALRGKLLALENFLATIGEDGHTFKNVDKVCDISFSCTDAVAQEF